MLQRIIVKLTRLFTLSIYFKLTRLFTLSIYFKLRVHSHTYDGKFRGKVFVVILGSVMSNSEMIGVSVS